MITSAFRPIQVENDIDRDAPHFGPLVLERFCQRAPRTLAYPRCEWLIDDSDPAGRSLVYVLVWPTGAKFPE